MEHFHVCLHRPFTNTVEVEAKLLIDKFFLNYHPMDWRSLEWEKSSQVVETEIPRTNL
jgi:hypothetical protein